MFFGDGPQQCFLHEIVGSVDAPCESPAGDFRVCGLSGFRAALLGAADVNFPAWLTRKTTFARAWSLYQNPLNPQNPQLVISRPRPSLTSPIRPSIAQFSQGK